MPTAQSGTGAINATKAAALAAGAQLGVEGAKAFQQAQSQLNATRAADLGGLNAQSRAMGISANDPAYAAPINSAIDARQAALGASQAQFAAGNRLGQQSIGDYLDATRASLGATAAYAKAHSGGGGRGGGSGSAGAPSATDVAPNFFQVAAQLRAQQVGDLLHQAHGAQITGGSASARGLGTVQSTPTYAGEAPVSGTTDQFVANQNDRAEGDFRNRQKAIGQLVSLSNVPTGTTTTTSALPPTPPTEDQIIRMTYAAEKAGRLPQFKAELQAKYGKSFTPGQQASTGPTTTTTQNLSGPSPEALARANVMQQQLSAMLSDAQSKAQSSFSQRDKAISGAQGALGRGLDQYAQAQVPDFLNRLVQAGAFKSQAAADKFQADLLGKLTPKAAASYEKTFDAGLPLQTTVPKDDPYAAAATASHIDPSFLNTATLPTYVVPAAKSKTGKAAKVYTLTDLATALGKKPEQVTAQDRKTYLADTTPLIGPQGYVEHFASAQPGSDANPFGFAGTAESADAEVANLMANPRIADLVAQTQGSSDPYTALQGNLIGQYVDALVRSAYGNRANAGQKVAPADALWNYYRQQLFR